MKKVNVLFQSTDEVQDFVRKAGHIDGELDLKFGSYVVDGKSIMGILSLGTHKVMELDILSENYEDFLKQIQDYIQQ